MIKQRIITFIIILATTYLIFWTAYVVGERLRCEKESYMISALQFDGRCFNIKYD